MTVAPCILLTVFCAPAPAPATVLRTDFTKPHALANWALDGLHASANGSFVPPTLVSGARCRLTGKTDLALAPYRQYRLLLDLRLAPFMRRHVTVILTHQDGPQSRLLLAPVRAYGQIHPPPVWVHEQLRFLTPGDVTGGRVELSFEAKGASHGMRLGLKRLQLDDVGPVPMRISPGPNLKRNPGLELDSAGLEATGWPKGSTVVTDPKAAHSGRRFCRIKGRGRLLSPFGGAFVEPPLVIRLRLWARGQGTLQARLRPWGAGYMRLTDQLGPRVQVGKQWTRYAWEVGIPRQSPLAVSFGMWLDGHSGGQLDLDDAEIRVISVGGLMGQHDD